MKNENVHETHKKNLVNPLHEPGSANNLSLVLLDMLLLLKRCLLTQIKFLKRLDVSVGKHHVSNSSLKLTTQYFGKVPQMVNICST